MEYDKRTYLQSRHYVSGISFNRNWTSYRDRFGDIYKSIDIDFWWGIDNAYYLTNSKSYNLVVQVAGQDYTDVGNIVYKNFVVQKESNKFAMSYSSVYIVPLDQIITLSMNGSMTLSNGAPFSTYDQDNDQSIGNCAAVHSAGWWFNDCTNCNPNSRLWPGGNSSRLGVDDEFFWNDGLYGWSAWATALWFTR
ncbi:angiopoietin-related protein 1-like [Mizuhopecten yessoensis]|nr:angiopoietin-related protein 1-like [Mizuhopecten yessoensis]